MDTKANRKWLVVTKSEFDSMDVDYSKIKEVDASHIRWNNAGTECILAYNGSKPDFLSSITGVMNHDEGLSLLVTSDRIAPDYDEI